MLIRTNNYTHRNLIKIVQTHISQCSEMPDKVSSSLIVIILSSVLFIEPSSSSSKVNFLCTNAFHLAFNRIIWFNLNQTKETQLLRDEKHTWIHLRTLDMRLYLKLYFAGERLQRHTTWSLETSIWMPKTFLPVLTAQNLLIFHIVLLPNNFDRLYVMWN